MYQSEPCRAKELTRADASARFSRRGIGGVPWRSRRVDYNATNYRR